MEGLQVTARSYFRAGQDDLDGPGGVREGNARGHGGDFQGTPLGPAVRPVMPDVSGRDLVPRQPGELGMQARLVALDGDQEIGAALPGQVLRVGALRMQRIGGDHRPGQVDPVQQHREQRDLIRLGLDIDLAKDHAADVVQRGQQMPPGLPCHSRSAQHLAIHRDQPPATRGGGGALLSPRAGLIVQGISIQPGGRWTRTAPRRSPRACAARKLDHIVDLLLRLRNGRGGGGWQSALGGEKCLVVASDIIHRGIEPLIRRKTRSGEVATVTDVTSGTTLLSRA